MDLCTSGRISSDCFILGLVTKLVDVPKDGRSGSGSHQSELQGMTWRVLITGLAQSQPSQLEVREQGS